MTARARCPLKILESLAMGTPVVTGDAGDRREMLQDGAAGKLVAPGHVEALADGITHLLLDSDLRIDMGHRAKEAVQAYFWDTLVNQFLKAYG
jgi:glycosyltransferase involved in cell wall biosynthesis